MPFNSFLDYPLTWKPDKEKLTRPIYKSIADAMERDIASGLLPVGTKLPPQRELANFLDINFTTVTRAYKICELRGLISAVTGSGTFVSPNATRSISISTELSPDHCINLGFVSSFESCNDLIAPVVKSIFSKRQFSDLATYDYPSGMPHQKNAGIAWMDKLGLHTDPKHMAIVAGAQNGLALSLIGLFEPGDRIAVDAYTFANFIELAQMYHLQLVPVDGDLEGMSAKSLDSQCKRNKIHGIFLMPSCTNPTNIMISEKRKSELAEIIKKHGLILIEDDFHAFMTAGIVEDYKGPLSRFLPDQSVYLCSTAKSICSGLRIAYMVFSENFRDKLLNTIYNINVKTSSIDAEITTELIVSGKANEILAKKYELASHANDIFYSYFPEAPRSGHPLSFYKWMPINDNRKGIEIENELIGLGLIVFHSDRFRAGPKSLSPFLRIALSTVQTFDELHRGLGTLRSWIDKMK